MVYVFLADGFEEVEALAPIDMLRRVGVSVVTVGVGTKTPVGAHGIPVTADIDDSAVTTDGLEAVVLPGGMPGTCALAGSKTVASVLDYAAANGLVIGAICAAPSILGKRGLLDGKAYTCFPGFETAPSVCPDSLVVCDGPIITARGAGAALRFGKALVAALCGDERADTLWKEMQCE